MLLCAYHGLTMLVAMATNSVAGSQENTPRESASADCQPTPLLTSTLGPAQSLVFPVLLVNGTVQPLVTLDSSSQAHQENIEIGFDYAGRGYTARLQLNREIQTKKYYREDGSEGQADLDLQSEDSCYYQGVFKNPVHTEDFVTLSTCSGIRGTLRMNGEIFSIRPLLSSTQLCHPHVMTKLSSVALGTCSNSVNHWDGLSKLHSAEYYRLLSQSPQSSKVQRNLEQKQLKLGLVVDNTLFSLFSRNTSNIREYLLDTVNVIDLFYQRVNIRVSLVYDQIWSVSDDIDVGPEVKGNLNNFVKYVSSRSPMQGYNILHLLSGKKFDLMGLAMPISICTDRAVAVISAKHLVGNSQRLASVIAHMIGHNIGLEHDETGCQCESSSGMCIMGNFIDLESPSLFSSCSIDRLRLLTQVQLGQCLAEEPPPYPYTQICGNGVIERGEQCDCGPPVVCQQTDPCCDPNTCLLKTWAVCTTGACCDSCRPKPTTTQCRAARNDCDAPEYCDGVGGECPTDVSIQDGQPCADGAGFCYQGVCPTHGAQCQSLWGENSTSSLAACYTRQNQVGSVLGHCGVTSDGDFRPCITRDVLCGLLQCMGGEMRPIVDNVDYRRTSTNEYSNGLTELTCKSVSGRPGSAALNLGMVQDGTKCGDQRLCQGHRCVKVDRLRAPGCDVYNNLTCSGNGRCTSDERCSCNKGYSGKTCGTMLPTERVTVMTSKPPVIQDRHEEKESITHGVLAVAILIPLILVAVCGVVLFSYRWKKLCFREVKRESVIKCDQTALAMSSRSSSLVGARSSSRQAAWYQGSRRRHHHRQQRPNSFSASSGDDDSNEDSEDGYSPFVVYDVPVTGNHIKGILKKPTTQHKAVANSDCSSECSCSGSTSSSSSIHSEDQLPAAPGRIPVPDERAGQQVPALVDNPRNASDRRYSTEQHDSNSDSAIDLSKGDSGTPTPAENAPISPTGRLKQSLSARSNSQFQPLEPQVLVQSGACSSNAFSDESHAPFLPKPQPIVDPRLTLPLREEDFNACSDRPLRGPMRTFQPYSSATNRQDGELRTVVTVEEPLISNNT